MVASLGRTVLLIFIEISASDLPWTLSRVRLSVQLALFAFSETAHGKWGWGGGGVIIGLADDDCTSLKGGNHADCILYGCCARDRI